METGWTKEKIDEVRDIILEKSTIDAVFRERLLADPGRVIEDIAGIPLPPDYNVAVVEKPQDVSELFVLPDFVDEDLSDEDLDAVAGGGCKNHKVINCTGANSFHQA